MTSNDHNVPVAHYFHSMLHLAEPAVSA